MKASWTPQANKSLRTAPSCIRTKKF